MPRHGDPPAAWRRHAARCAVAMLLALLGGCGGKPMPFPAPESELGERPGLLTGETGVYVLHPLEQPSAQSR